MKLSLPALREMKRDGRPIVMITAYDHPSGRIVDAAGVDLVLVGDSAANVVLGHESTVPATMDEMTMLTAAVNRGVENALVIGDLPFMSYQVSDAEAVANAGRLIKEGGADVVKLEGAGPSLDRVRALVSAGIGVMGHIGLTPQTATALGGHKAQGRQADAARRLFAGRDLAGTGGLLRDRAGGGAGAGGDHHQPAARDPHHRHRLRRRHRRPGAGAARHARHPRRRPSRASSSATPRSAS